MTTPEDPRIVQAIALFQRAWLLLDDAQQLRRELGTPASARDAATRDERERNAYARLVVSLEACLRSGYSVAASLVPPEFQHRIFPDNRKRGEGQTLTGDEWLRHREGDLGSGESTS